MSKTSEFMSATHKPLLIFSLIAGVGMIAFGLFQCYALVDMANDNLEYASTLLRLRDGATLPVPPPERFLGAGLLGIWAPVILSVLGTTTSLYAYTHLGIVHHNID